MKQRKRAQSSSLFLMELIIAILFFSITAAVCVQLFVQSHLISQQSSALNQAINHCSSIAELLSSSTSYDDFTTYLNESYTVEDNSNTTQVLYFDQQFNACSSSDAIYKIEIISDVGDTLISMDITTYTIEDNSVLYSIETSLHLARSVAHE